MPMLLFAAYAASLALAVVASIALLRGISSDGVGALPLFGGTSVACGGPSASDETNDGS
jgi:hypothetical protein